MRAIGLLGSVEALAPALAPIAGIWLLAIGGWQLSFEVIGALALVLAGTIWAFAAIPQTARRHEGSNSRLLRDLVYLRYALSQALVLGGLLIFVFGLPAAFVHALGATLRDFVIVQICGIARSSSRQTCRADWRSASAPSASFSLAHRLPQRAPYRF